MPEPWGYCSGCGVVPAGVTHICPPLLVAAQPITLPADPKEGDVLIAPNAVYEFKDGEWVAQEETPE